jgi:hypothetical protein
MDTTAGLAPANLSFAGWSLGCSGTSWSEMVEPAGFAPAPCGLKVRCAAVEHHSSKVVRSGRIALPTPDWQTGALLLRHERRLKMAAPTGVAPASLGLKGRDPELLDDKAENETRGRHHRLTPSGAPHVWCRAALRRSCAFAKKNTHRRPSRQTTSAGLDGRRICTRTLG